MSQPSVLRMIAVPVSALLMAWLVAGFSGAPKDHGVAISSEQPRQPSHGSAEPTRPAICILVTRTCPSPIVGSLEAGDDTYLFAKGAWAEFITYYLADRYDVFFDDSPGEYEGDAQSMAQFGGYLAQFGDMAKGKLAGKLAADGATTAEVSGMIEALIAVSEKANDVGVQVQDACTGVDSRPSAECQSAWAKVGETVDALFDGFEPWWCHCARFISSAESAGQEAGKAVKRRALTPEQAGDAWVAWARESASAGSDFMDGYFSTGAYPWWEVCEDSERTYIPTAVPTAGEKPGQCPEGARVVSSW